MKIEHKEHTVVFDANTGTLTIAGMLRLMTKDYTEIRDLLEHIVLLAPPRLAFDIRSLKMINSSGLNTMSRFVLALRGKPEVHVTFHGSNEIIWQAKTLANMKHFLPTAQIVLH